MNLLDFKQTTSYFTKKRPIVFLLYLFSLVCAIVSVQSGAVFIHSFLSAYVPDINWFFPYAVACSIDLLLFYLCAQMFSDVFCGLEGKSRYLDLPTSLLFFAFLALSLFMSIKGADVRKSHHAVELATNTTTETAINKMVASLDTSKVIVKKGIERNERKALEEKAKLSKANTENQQLILSALQIHNEQQVTAKREFSELLDFSKTIVVIFQLLLILCCACSEFIKSKKEPKSNSKSGKSALKVGKSGQKQHESKSAIGFLTNKSEGDINRNTIAYMKVDGSLKYYTSAQLSSMITEARTKKKEERALKFEDLQKQLKNALTA